MSLTPSGAQVRWLDLAEALDLGEVTETLPQRVSCPLCRVRSLNVYDEPSQQGGLWLHCKNCRQFGDAIRFTAIAWKTTPGIVLERFVDLQILGTPDDDTATADQRRLSTTQRIIEFSGKSLNRLPHLPFPELGFALRNLGVDTQIPKPQWDLCLRGFVGVTTRREVQDLYLREPDRRIWSHAIVLPWSTSPGQATGLQFIRDTAATSEDLYRLAPGGKCWGLYGTANGFMPERPIILQSSRNVLYLQSRHARQHAFPLPFLAFFDDGSRSTNELCYQPWSGRPIVFWSPDTMSSAVLLQAMSCDGCISLRGPAGKTSLQEYLNMTPPKAHAKRIVSTSKPWTRALSDWCCEVKLEEVDNLVHELASRQCDVYAVGNALEAGDGRDIWRNACRPKLAVLHHRTVWYKNRQILSRPDGWWIVRTGSQKRMQASRSGRTQLSNFTFRLREIEQRNGVIKYCGELQIRQRLLEVKLLPEVCVLDQLKTKHIWGAWMLPKWAKEFFSLVAVFDPPA